jgi:hypothetical protein
MSIGKFAENLGAPDIKLAEFQLWVHSRQFPPSEDFWYGNWLNVTAHCGSQGADVWANGSILGAPDIASWLVALEEMNRTLSGEAYLGSLEPELRVELKMESRGHIWVRVEITPDHMTQEHVFQFEVDQSYLRRLIEDCRKVLAKYPVRGKPEHNGEA